MKNFILLTQTDKSKPIEIRHGSILTLEPRNEDSNHTKINMVGIPYPIFVTESRAEIEALIDADGTEITGTVEQFVPTQGTALDPVDDPLARVITDPIPAAPAAPVEPPPAPPPAPAPAAKTGKRSST